MKNDTVFSVRIPLDISDMICEIGGGSRREGLMNLVTSWNMQADDQTKALIEQITDLKAQLEDRRALCRRYKKMVDELEKRLG